jgi:cytochrome o ubiquinol oxidase subunit 3|tara:strand:+ start:2426 stop:3223 length:798 start_codon:yes stop_codon:yes gene_type:complete
MADHAVDGHGALEELTKTSTGIEHKKLVMWAFLGSDCMFFGTLISTHLIYRKLYPDVVDTTRLFDIELTGLSSFILLMSSFLMALTVSAAHKNNVKAMRGFLAGTILFGCFFLSGQVYEFFHFVHGKGTYEFQAINEAGEAITGLVANDTAFHSGADTAHAKHVLEHKHHGWEIESFKQVDFVEGLTLGSSVFGSTFFLMTGTHGVHVLLGVIWLLGWFIRSFSKKYTAVNALDIEVAGLYWHFVDIVWIIIFTAVYLVEYIKFY